jgi:hypothetical protein
MILAAIRNNGAVRRIMGEHASLLAGEDRLIYISDFPQDFRERMPRIHYAIRLTEPSEDLDSIVAAADAVNRLQDIRRVMGRAAIQEQPSDKAIGLHILLSEAVVIVDTAKGIEAFVCRSEGGSSVHLEPIEEFTSTANRPAGMLLSEHFHQTINPQLDHPLLPLAETSAFYSKTPFRTDWINCSEAKIAAALRAIVRRIIPKIDQTESLVKVLIQPDGSFTVTLGVGVSLRDELLPEQFPTLDAFRAHLNGTVFPAYRPVLEVLGAPKSIWIQKAEKSYGGRFHEARAENFRKVEGITPMMLRFDGSSHEAIEDEALLLSLENR